MPRSRHDEPLDDFDDFDDDSAEDGSETIRCPECRAEIYEDAVRCPHCGSYITADTSPWSGRSLSWIALGLLGIIAMVLALVLGR